MKHLQDRFPVDDVQPGCDVEEGIPMGHLYILEDGVTVGLSYKIGSDPVGEREAGDQAKRVALTMMGVEAGDGEMDGSVIH